MSDVDSPDFVKIPLSIRVRHSPDAFWVPIGSELVVHSVSRATSHVLDAMAGLLWQCIDGESRIEAILDDISDVYDVELDRVVDDFLPIVASWLNDGILEVVNDD